MSRRHLKLIALEAVVPIVLLLAWWFGSAGSTSVFYPPLKSIAEAFQLQWLSGLSPDLVASLYRLGIGFGIAVVAGVGLGFVLAGSPRLNQAFGPVVEFARFLPPPVTAPIFIILWGIGDLAKIVFIVFGAIWPILMNTVDGARSVDDVKISTARVYGITGWRRLVHLTLPASGPRIAVGIRNGLAAGLITMAVGEMIGSSDGVGYVMLRAQQEFATPEMWSGMIMLGLLGYALNAILTIIEHRVLFWHLQRRT